MNREQRIGEQRMAEIRAEIARKQKEYEEWIAKPHKTVILGNPVCSICGGRTISVERQVCGRDECQEMYRKTEVSKERARRYAKEHYRRKYESSYDFRESRRKSSREYWNRKHGDDRLIAPEMNYI